MNIGYKATCNGTCDPNGSTKLTYEIGRTYTFHGKVTMCISGFHYCKNPNDVLKYYDLTKNLVVFEVEDLGDKNPETGCKTIGDKTVTNKIKVLRQVFPASKEIQDEVGIKFLIEYDEKGKVIRYKDAGKLDTQYKYDEQGNKVYMRSSLYLSDGKYEKWMDYDQKGNLIHSKDSNNDECWYEYNEKGKLIHTKDINGFERWNKYDENSNLIHSKDSMGYEWWKEYDEKGNLVHYKDSGIAEEWKKYDENGNLVYYKNSCGYQEWYTYNEKGNLVHYKDSDGYQRFKEYDEKNNVVYYNDAIGDEWSITIE
jgi:YD repeat-containing protein